jgi:DNA (cytosine-5)-methyltransferase 1
MRQLKFIDLFAGIGGMRLAFEAAGTRCVFTSEYDAYAQKTYRANFTGAIAGDITTIPVDDIPRHDILVAGFPCQPFSIAGVSKKNSLGRAHGFNDPTQGTLFFNIKKILAVKRPQAFLLENVKHLRRHDGGKTFDVILRTLQDDLGYHVQHRVLDGRHFVPQHRERIYIVGFRRPLEFSWPVLPDKNPTLVDILDASPEAKYTLSDRLWKYLQGYAAKHKAAGNGFGFGLVGPNDVARTLSARYYKDGSEILIRNGKTPRRLSPRECARLMGYEEDFKIPVSDTRAYKQFGNSVVVPLVTAIASEVVKCLERNHERPRSRRLAGVVGR